MRSFTPAPPAVAAALLFAACVNLTPNWEGSTGGQGGRASSDTATGGSGGAVGPDAASAGLNMIVPVGIIFRLSQYHLFSGAIIG